MKNRHKCIFLIIIIILYLLRLLQIYLYYSTNFELKTSIIIEENTKSCLYDTDYYRMIVPECATLETGKRILVIAQEDSKNPHQFAKRNPTLSNLSTLFDKDFKKQKSLIVTDLQYYHYQWYSPKDWLLFIEEKITQVGNRFTRVIAQNTSLSTSWLVVNSVLGYVVLIPEEYQKVLAIFGLQHVIAVSGFHISFFVIALLSFFPKQWPRSVQTTFIVIFICGYWFLVGSQPSVNRAVVMSIGSVLLSKCFFLQFQPIRLLIATAILWIIVDPLVVSSVSFQLSYIATLGILTFFTEQNSGSSSLVAAIESGSIDQISHPSFIGLFRETIVITLVAQLYTIPVIWYYFSQYPLLSLPASIFFYWLPPLLIVLGSIAFSVHFLTYLPLVQAEMLLKVLVYFAATLPAMIVIQLLKLGSIFPHTLITLPPLDTKYFACLLTVLFVITVLKRTFLANKRKPWVAHIKVICQKI